MDVSNPSQFSHQRLSSTRFIQWEFQSNRLCTDISTFPPTERWKGENSWGCVSSTPCSESQPPPCLRMSSTKQYLLCTWISAPFLWRISPQKWQVNPRTETGAGEGEAALGGLNRSKRACSFLLGAGFDTSYWKLRRKKKRHLGLV